MNKKNTCKLLAWTMTAALTLTADPSTGMMASAKNTSKVSTKWYTISKKPGTYQQKVTLKVTAKKGFQVYYTTNGTFRLKKKINSSNNTCVISGGSLTLSSSDDGITVADTLDITGDTDINIKTCYEGIEAGTINIGTKDSQSGPDIVIYSNDDGINAASKSSTTYVYADESEEKYTKTTVSSSDNVLNVYSGYVNVMIADDETHTITLPVKNGNNNTITYSADGDGIDCNGSFYAYGGTIIVFGSTSSDNSPIDTDSTYYIGSGVTLLAVGSSGMIENPTSVRQAYLCTGSSNGGMRFASASTSVQGGNSRP